MSGEHERRVKVRMKKTGESREDAVAFFRKLDDKLRERYPCPNRCDAEGMLYGGACAACGGKGWVKP